MYCCISHVALLGLTDFPVEARRSFRHTHTHTSTTKSWGGMHIMLNHGREKDEFV